MTLPNKYFLSCDWGTSSFRLRLVNAASLQVMAEDTGGAGIAETHRRWSGSGEPRDKFFADVLLQRMAALAEATGISPEGVPVVLSGMASSSIGMVELPYAQLPFGLDGAGLEVRAVGRFTVISGAAGGGDVMRGEETKVVGCAPFLQGAPGPQYLLLPGTHPKHITVTDKRVTACRTFMTGEFFELLSVHSILRASVTAGGRLEDHREAFADGLRAGISGDLLHGAFLVRTRQLLEKVPAEANYFYLSGMLIGAELGALPQGGAVYLVAGPSHAGLYTLACELLNIPLTATIDADEALIRGQRTIVADA